MSFALENQVRELEAKLKIKEKAIKEAEKLLNLAEFEMDSWRIYTELDADDIFEYKEGLKKWKDQYLD